MKRLVLALLVFAAAGGLWFASQKLGGSPSADESASPAVSVDEAEDSAREPARSVADEDVLPVDGEPQAEPGSARSEARGEDGLDLRTATIVTVTARLPAGTPPDEELVARAWRTPPSEDELTAGLDDDDRRSERVTTFPAQPDGRLEVAFPADAERGWVSVHGRYAYPTEARPVDLAADAPTVAIDLALGAWVRGRVTLPADVAAANVEELEVELVPDPMAAAGGAVNPFLGTVEERTATVRALAFEHRGVPSGSGWTVQVVPDGLGAHKSEPLDVEPGGRYDVVVPLVRGGLVTGRVVDPAGRPVAGADVDAQQHAIWFGAGGLDVRSGETDDDGRFELAAVAPGETRLEIEADGYVEAYEKLVVADGGRHTGLVVELSEGATISGRVTFEDGTVASGVEVDVRFDVAGAMGMGGFNAAVGARGSAETDEDGTFRVTGLGKGPFTVACEAPPPGEEDGESSDDEAWSVRRNGVEPDTEDLELVLLPPVGLAGRVVDHEGQPVESFSVTTALLLENSPIQGIGVERRTLSFAGENGAFRFPKLDRGYFSVTVDAEGYASPEPVEVPVPQEEELVIAIEPGASVTGIVLGPDGQPFAGAEVTLALELQDLIQSRTGQLDVPSTTSDGDGRFELTELRGGAANLVARAHGAAESLPVPADLAPGETTTDVTLHLRRGARLTGDVFDNEGEPAAGIQVIAQTTTGQHQRIVRTAGDGTFAIEHLTPESYQVIAMMSDLGQLGGEDGDTPDAAAMLSNMKMKMVTLADEEELHVVLGAPPEFPVVVSGRVTVDGVGLDDLYVQFIPHGQDGLGGMKIATTADGGEYELQLDGPGTYQVAISAADVSGTARNSIEFTETIEQQDAYELDFALPVGRIRGRVTGNGEPLVNTRVTLSQDGPVRSGTMLGGHYVDTLTDEDGRYEIEWVRPGTYTIAAGGSALGGLFGDDPKSFGRRVREDVEVRENEDVRGVDFDLEKPGAVTGVVVDPAGRPVPEATVFVETESGAALERFSFISSDAAGRFRYSGLAPGRYRVNARGAGHASESPVPVEVRSGEDTEVELVVREGAMLVVTIVDDEGEPLQVDVVVRDEDDRQVNGQLSIADLTEAFQGGDGFSLTDERVGPLPPGRYRVEATALDGRTARKLVRIRPGEAEQRVTVRVRE